MTLFRKNLAPLTALISSNSIPGNSNFYWTPPSNSSRSPNISKQLHPFPQHFKNVVP